MEPIKFTEDNKIILPQPHEISKREKEDAMGAYLMMFAAWAIGLPIPLVNFIAALIYYLINKKDSRFVTFHAYQSLITQAIISIFNAAIIFWSLRYFFILVDKDINNFSNRYYLISLIFVIIWNLVYTVYSLIACAKAYKGKFFYMLFFGRIAFKHFYGPRAQAKEKIIETNEPPAGI